MVANHDDNIDLVTIIPYLENKHLGAAYNKAMEQSVKDWVLFIDHDVFLVNPDWYHLCINAIRTVGHEAGWITAKTNRITSKCLHQRRTDAPKSDNLVEHGEFSQQIYRENGKSLVDITSQAKLIPLSGFFILTHKEAWKKIGGCQRGFLGVDNAYCEALIKAEYKIYLMSGLYVYHRYNRDWKVK